MSGQAREASETGTYHVMMCSINHQKIFEDEEDNLQFNNTLNLKPYSYFPIGLILP